MRDGKLGFRSILGEIRYVLEPTTPEVFRVVSTHVLATRLDRASLVQALRAGRTYVVIDLWRDGSGFAFWADDGTGCHEMGSTVSHRAVLSVRSPAPAEIRLLRGADVVAVSQGKSLVHRDPRPGVYRVEVRLRGDPWILSSPILVRAAAPQDRSHEN